MERDPVKTQAALTRLSIIIPFYNEQECVSEVLDEVVGLCPGAEVIAIDDGSSDATWERIRDRGDIRALRFAVNRGQSAAMYAGLRNATREICVLMDGDGQNDPANIVDLLRVMEEQGADMVCGYRAQRKDTASRRWASRIANKIRRAFIDDGLRDTGCSLKAFRREAVDHLVCFNGMHRYLAAVMRWAGLQIVEVPVNHRPRSAGQSKYTNWDRALRGIYDLIGVCWLLKRKVKFDVAQEATKEKT